MVPQRPRFLRNKESMLGEKIACMMRLVGRNDISWALKALCLDARIRIDVLYNTKANVKSSMCGDFCLFCVTPSINASPQHSALPLTPYVGFICRISIFI